MCAIVGAVLRNINNSSKLASVNLILEYIWQASFERGRDGRGFVINSSTETNLIRFYSTEQQRQGPAPRLDRICYSATVIGNLRAEPTTEFVLTKREHDQQPYSLSDWSIVHNGTIANDKELRTNLLPTAIDSSAIVEQLAEQNCNFRVDEFADVIRSLRGSYAILAANNDHSDSLLVAVNYRPLWYIQTEFGVFFASSRAYFPKNYPPQMLQPYTAAKFDGYGIQGVASLYPDIAAGERALVVCSGGLDSVVSATYAQRKLGMSIHLIHFLYGSRAEGPEVEAVKAVAENLGAELTLFNLPVYSKGDSPLLDPDSKVAGGEAGAEFAHEWVPARNLLLLSVATAFAEARGIDTIVLGNNLEEAGAYPDNEPEFISRFNDLLPFAVGDGKRMRVIMPVGNMMKHEIVALGKQIDAPMHLTWSCYRADELHCGTCGPCYMRRKAFEINGIPEVITYKDRQ